MRRCGCLKKEKRFFFLQKTNVYASTECKSYSVLYGIWVYASCGRIRGIASWWMVPRPLHQMAAEAFHVWMAWQQTRCSAMENALVVSRMWWKHVVAKKCFGALSLHIACYSKLHSSILTWLTAMLLARICKPGHSKVQNRFCVAVPYLYESALQCWE